MEQGDWVVGGSCCCRCFPSYHRHRSAHLTSHPGLPGLLPQRESGNFQLEGTRDWTGWILDLGEIGCSEPPQDWGQRQWFSNNTGRFLLKLSLEELQRKSRNHQIWVLQPRSPVPESLTVGGFTAENQWISSPLHYMLLNCHFFPFPPGKTSLKYTFILQSVWGRYICAMVALDFLKKSNSEKFNFSTPLPLSFSFSLPSFLSIDYPKPAFNLDPQGFFWTRGWNKSEFKNKRVLGLSDSPWNLKFKKPEHMSSTGYWQRDLERDLL